MGQGSPISTPRTGNRDWLTSAASAGDFVATFKDDAGASDLEDVGSQDREAKTGFRKAGKLMEIKVQLARFMTCSIVTSATRPIAEQPRTRCAISPVLREMTRALPGVLLADEELASSRPI